MAALSGKFPEKKFKPLGISGCKPPSSSAFTVTWHIVQGQEEIRIAAKRILSRRKFAGNRRDGDMKGWWLRNWEGGEATVKPEGLAPG